MSVINKTFSCYFKGIHLNCVQGDIVNAETDAIAIICDPDFTLSYGIGSAIKNAAGPNFLNDLDVARRNRDSNVIAVGVSTIGIRASYVLLAPVRKTARNSLDKIYIDLIQKAINLRQESLTMPLLGTGGLSLSFTTAANSMKTGLTHFTNFGSIKRLQFIDTSVELLRSLRQYIVRELMSSSYHHSNGTETRDQGLSFRALGSGTAESPVQLYRRHSGSLPATRNASGQVSGSSVDADTSVVTINSTSTDLPRSSNDNRRSSRHSGSGPNRCMQIDISITMEGGDLSSPATSDSDSVSSSSSDEMEEDELSSTSDRQSRRGMNGDNSDHEDENDDMDSEIDLDSSEVMDSDDMLDTDMDGSNMASDDEESGDEQFLMSKEQEARFWTVIPLEQLSSKDESSSQKSNKDKPSTSAAALARSGASQSKQNANNFQGNSSFSMRNPNVNLDDSTLPCSICLGDMRESVGDEVVQLSLCTHMFHKECIKAAFKVKRQCPLCMLWYGEFIGYQPVDATMEVRQIPGKVPGYKNAKGYHEITYHIPAGIQMEGHIRPGQPYRSSTRTAYLPNNTEGTQVLKMLQMAFKRRLIFTIGDSVSTGRKNVPVWNNIHHKTNKDGGPQSYGYPDPGYLSRVKEELAMVGVRSDQLN